MQPIPYIPENAPFSTEQRGWLNGFLAGLFSGTMPAAAIAEPKVTAPSLKIAVLHASQSGTAESLAHKVAKELKAKGHSTTLAALDTYTPHTLANEQHAVLIASTYGEGDPPDAVKPFFQQLSSSDAPQLDKLSYTVLALGDKHYEHFCKFGSDLDERLQSLGARRIAPRVECDVEVDEAFARWKENLLQRLEQISHGTTPEPAKAWTQPVQNNVAPVGKTYTRDNPFHAPLVERRALTQDVSSKLTVHLAFCLCDAGMHYEAGDALGVVGRNDDRLVDEVLAAAHLNGSEAVAIPRLGATTSREALINHLQFTKINRKLVEFFATKAESSILRGLLVPEQQSHLESYCHDRGLIDLLHDYPGVITSAEELVKILPRLSPRLYSISSSPAAHGSQVHTTVAVVRYRSHNRDRGGVCSTLLGERLQPREKLPIYIQPNKRFRLPQQTDAPIIMIGPGTGIAPFRAFLHERRALGSTGRNWLFFGERNASTDFLYRDELLKMQTDGHLTRLDLAFSREREHTVYVQDRMLEQAPEFWRWLEAGASVYVCGDASRMAKDVDATLHRIVEQQGNLAHEAASEYVQQLKDQHRYHRDVY